MSEIIKFIITYVIYFLVCLAAMLPIALYHTRQIEKLIDNFFHEVKESRAARLQSLKEVHSQVDELDKSAGEISESLDKTIEFKRLISEYLDNKIKRTEARENFCESNLGRKKYTLSCKTLLGSEREKSHYKIPSIASFI